MNSQQLKKKKLPNSPGVYFFISKKSPNKPRSNNRNYSVGQVIYIGKATSLRDRVKSYFGTGLAFSRSPLITQMVDESTDIKWQETDSVLEALILEAGLIKKYQPKYNTQEKDNKSFNFVVITNEDFPRILLMRGRELECGSLLTTNYLLRTSFGPFPHGAQLKEALKIVRKIFPYRDKCLPALTTAREQAGLPAKIFAEQKLGRTGPQEIHTQKLNQARPCFNRQIGLCPGVCNGEISQKEYAKVVRYIEQFFQGKKKTLIRDLEKDMRVFGKKQEFEKANTIKKTIFALNHIQDVALLKNSGRSSASHPVASEASFTGFRIEAYDIAHMSGKDVVGVMTVVENGEIKKTDYKKFKIKGLYGGGVDDTGNLKEILSRRFNHPEWRLPDLIVVDGSTAQINVARKIIQEKNLKASVVAVTKDERHKARDIQGDKELVGGHREEILLANSESHRFAIAFHRLKSRKHFLK
ncbi:MAG: GIY-YIG nuclease family protein [Parcubacteria group bacterium]|nr:GIY-YIG nuclease family protein [Parcubacteria group bacterium]